MTGQEYQQLKEKMEARLVELEVSIKELKEVSKPLGLDNLVERLSRISYINNKAINESRIRK